MTKKKIFTPVNCFIFAHRCCELYIHNCVIDVFLLCVLCVEYSVHFAFAVFIFIRHWWNIIRMSRFDWNQGQCSTPNILCVDVVPYLFIRTSFVQTLDWNLQVSSIMSFLVLKLFSRNKKIIIMLTYTYLILNWTAIAVKLWTNLVSNMFCFKRKFRKE